MLFRKRYHVAALPPTELGRKRKAKHPEEKSSKPQATSTESTSPEPEAKKLAAEAKGGLGKIQQLKPVRVFQFYGKQKGALLASGLAYQGIFALFAALWFIFSIVGIIFAGNKALQQQLVSGLNSFVPGLIGGEGAVVPIDSLLQPQALGWSTVISLATILFTAVGFLATLRSAIRLIFELEDVKENFAVRKVKDLGIMVGLGLLVVLTTVVSIVTAAASALVFGIIGIDQDSAFAHFVAGAIGFVIIAGLDTVILASAIRVLSGIKVKWRTLLRTTLFGGLALAFLQTLGSGLLGAPKDNPLFASFAVIFGLFVFFNFVCQVILFCVSWLEVSRRDMGLTTERSKEPAAAPSQV